MSKWKNLKQQTLAGTIKDSQGEKNTKDFLVSLCETFNSKKQIPLNQEHNMSLDTIGYIKNFNVVPSKEGLNEWSLVGDVYFHDVDIDEALKGFSYSITETIKGDTSNQMIGVYLPFPYYNDTKLIDAILNNRKGVVVGAWKKKSADPQLTTLIISFALFFTAPAYTNFWNNKISPLIKLFYNNLKQEHSINFVQVCEGHKEESYGIYFIPLKGEEKKCLTQYKIMNGILLTKKYIDNDKLAKDKGVQLVRLVFSEANKSFEIKTIEYQDGSIINH